MCSAGEGPSDKWLAGTLKASPAEQVGESEGRVPPALTRNDKVISCRRTGSGAKRGVPLPPFGSFDARPSTSEAWESSALLSEWRLGPWGAVWLSFLRLPQGSQTGPPSLPVSFCLSGLRQPARRRTGLS
jgi:hypothetical protein